LPNLKFVKFDFDTFINDSPVKDFWLNKVRKGVSWKDQLSDILRSLLMLTYGGAYLDSDSASRMQIPTDIPNFILKGN